MKNLFLVHWLSSLSCVHDIIIIVKLFVLYNETIPSLSYNQCIIPNTILIASVISVAIGNPMIPTRKYKLQSQEVRTVAVGAGHATHNYDKTMLLKLNVYLCMFSTVRRWAGYTRLLLLKL